MRYWGYCMPELLSTAIIDHIGPSNHDLKIVDLGCGDGAVGEALRAKGFSNLAGLDISQGMLDLAKERGIYGSLQKADLSQDLPLEDESFDCAGSSWPHTASSPERWSTSAL